MTRGHGGPDLAWSQPSTAEHNNDEALAALDANPTFLIPEPIFNKVDANTKETLASKIQAQYFKDVPINKGSLPQLADVSAGKPRLAVGACLCLLLSTLKMTFAIRLNLVEGMKNVRLSQIIIGSSKMSSLLSLKLVESRLFFYSALMMIEGQVQPAQSILGSCSETPLVPTVRIIAGSL